MIGFIFVVALVFFYVAVRTLKTHAYWRDLARTHEQRIGQLREENERLISADPEDGDVREMGIARLRSELHKLLIDRGRVWYKCSPEQTDPRTGQVAVKTDLPDPHKISANTILYVFEEADIKDKGRYLGEFKVTDVAERRIDLKPAMKPTAAELKRLVVSRGPWTLYEIMPIDTHGVFAHLDDEQKKALLPGATAQEYTKDGKPAKADDPEDRVVEVKDSDGRPAGKQYVRMLRDYEILFKTYHQRRSILMDSLEATARDRQYVEAACADARKQQVFRENEVEQGNADVTKYRRERDAVAAFDTILKSRAVGMKAAVQQLIQTNKTLAGQIAKLQLEAAQRIDARTQSMARSDAAAGN